MVAGIGLVGVVLVRDGTVDREPVCLEFLAQGLGIRFGARNSVQHVLLLMFVFLGPCKLACIRDRV